MDAEGRMDLLKRTFKAAINDARTLGLDISLCAWDHSQEWFGDRMHWLTEQEYPRAIAWAQALTARGCTEMRPAIIQATTLPNVSDIVTLCDGAFYDFDVSSFKAFADKYPHLRFHFVAIGAGADTSKMSQMAQDGRGVFFQEMLPDDEAAAVAAVAKAAAAAEAAARVAYLSTQVASTTRSDTREQEASNEKFSSFLFMYC